MDYLQSKSRGDITAHITTNFPSHPQGFLVNISIGSPPIPQLLHMDTGSDLTWVQCSPCTRCYPQSLPIFDPSRSYTYLKKTCRTSEDSMPTLKFDEKSKTCEYTNKYFDGTGTKGTLATETLMFNTIYGESSSTFLAKVVFGCGHNNYGDPHIGTGILGLAYGEFSLVHRFSSKFSYCFGSLDDPSYPYNVLIIGDNGAEIIGDSTPLEIKNDVYYVKMEAISVDGIVLPINPEVFEHNYETSSGGTVLDTGSSVTILNQETYEPLKNEIEDIFDGAFTIADRYANDKFKMDCYNGDFDRYLVHSGFPTVAFLFSEGAALYLDEKSLFMKAGPNEFCLAVIPNIGGNMNIIGVNAQQNQNIGYDFKAMKVSFQSIECDALKIFE